MKRVIRSNIWETNSSSSHSVAVHGERSLTDYYDKKGPEVLEVHLGEYGWSGDTCDTFLSKLEYALSMVLHTEYPDFSHYDDFIVDQKVLEDLDGYRMIMDAIRKHFNCESILICRNNGYYPYGYIDHQSYEDYSSLQDFLDDWNVDIERFLFDNGVYVLIDNDNH